MTPYYLDIEKMTALQQQHGYTDRGLSVAMMMAEGYIGQLKGFYRANSQKRPGEVVAKNKVPGELGKINMGTARRMAAALGCSIEDLRYVPPAEEPAEEPATQEADPAPATMVMPAGVYISGQVDSSGILHLAVYDDGKMIFMANKMARGGNLVGVIDALQDAVGNLRRNAEAGSRA